MQKLRNNLQELSRKIFPWRRRWRVGQIISEQNSPQSLAHSLDPHALITKEEAAKFKRRK